MGYVPYDGFATYRRATVNIRLYFKKLIFMKCFKKKKRAVTIIITLYQILFLKATIPQEQPTNNTFNIINFYTHIFDHFPKRVQ